VTKGRTVNNDTEKLSKTPSKRKKCHFYFSSLVPTVGLLSHGWLQKRSVMLFCGIASGGIMLSDGVGTVWMQCAGRMKEKVWQGHTISSYTAAFLRELSIGLKNMSPEENG
jgi:hypothetical protein